MNLPVDFLPDWLAWSGLAVFAPLVLWNAWGAPWRLLHRNLLVPVYLVAVALLCGLWAMTFESQAGLGLHFLGLTAMVLVFGWRLALVAGAAALGLLSALDVYDPWAWGVNGLITVALPVALATRLHALIYRLLPKHYFVYLIVSAHFASMALIAAVMLAVSALLLALGAHDTDRIVNDYLLFLPIAMLPEGFINGAILSMLTALKPEWVRSFDDRDYIDGK